MSYCILMINFFISYFLLNDAVSMYSKMSSVSNILIVTDKFCLFFLKIVLYAVIRVKKGQVLMTESFQID
jgi:hypothetical protein